MRYREGIGRCWIALAIGAFVGLGCGGRDESSPAQSNNTGSTTTGDDDDDDGAAPPTGGADPSTSGADSSGGSSDEAGFILQADAPLPAFECSTWDEDCPEGMKCMPWAHNSGSTWTGFRCSPVAADPAGVGEPCTVEESPYSGIDDCEQHALCSNVDPNTLEGICVAFCTGTPEDPGCADPGSTCAVGGGSSFAICLPGCSPLDDGCAEGWGCQPIVGEFLCAPAGELGAGDQCEHVTDCERGTSCLSADFVGMCGDAVGCCSPFCDLGDPDPPCLDGQACVPLGERNAEVGVCALAPG